MKIYVFHMSGEGYGWMNAEHIGFALTEDGRICCQRVCHDEQEVGSALVLLQEPDADKIREAYERECSEGYTLEYVDDPENHEGLQAAISQSRLNLEPFDHFTGEDFEDGKDGIECK